MKNFIFTRGFIVRDASAISHATSLAAAPDQLVFVYYVSRSRAAGYFYAFALQPALKFALHLSRLCSRKRASIVADFVEATEAYLLAQLSALDRAYHAPIQWQ